MWWWKSKPCPMSTAMQLSKALQPRLNLWPQHGREASSTATWLTNSPVAKGVEFVSTLFIAQRIETNTELQKPCQLCWKKQQLCFLLLALYFPAWTLKDCICFLSHQSTLWACVQLIIHLDDLVLFCIIAISSLVSCMQPRCITVAFLLKFPVTT